MPLPDYSDEENPYLFNERIQLPGVGAVSEDGDDLPPFGMTDREYEIAQLAHLKNAEVAFLLKITPETVKSHFSRIIKKIGIHSKHEIPYFLHNILRVPEPASTPLLEPPKSTVMEPESSTETEPTCPATVTITVTASPRQLEGLLDWLANCESANDS